MEKVGKKKLIVLLGTIGALLLATVLLVAGLLIWKNSQEDNADFKEALYWNADRAEYAGTPENGGMSTRKKGKDGYYQIVFAVDGKQVTLNAKDKRLVNQLDSEDLMGLGFDEDGVIIEKKKVEDITGGLAAVNFVVEEVTAQKIVANSSLELRGVQKKFILGANTGIYDVSGTGKFVGEPSSVKVGDRITAVQDKEGKITHIFVISRAEVLAEQVRYCQHCNSEVAWYEWNKKDTLPITAGHWFLTRDVSMGGTSSIDADTTVVLDLNGHTVKGADGKRIYSMYKAGTNLSIMDTSAEGTGKMVSRGAAQAGNVVLAGFGTFELYSGTLDGSQVTAAQNGGTVKVLADAMFHMYGGTIVGSNLESGLSVDMKSTVGGYGGSVYVSGVFVLDDGVIRGGKARAYHDKDKNTYQRGFGGNVHVAKGGEFTMTGGKLEDGRSDRGGGNLRIDDKAVFTMTGGEIIGGTASLSGGNGGNISAAGGAVIYMKGGKIAGGITNSKGGNLAVSGEFHMSGGMITGGISKKDGVKDKDATHHNMLLLYSSKFHMSGGTIEGYVAAIRDEKKAASVKVSGNARIAGGTKGLYLMDGIDLEVGTMTKGACIYIARKGFFSGKTSASNAQYFHSEHPETNVIGVQGRLFAGTQHCVCGAADGKHSAGCNGEQLLWKPWTSTKSAPASEGNWYLTGDVKSGGQASVPENAKVCVDLNGHSIYGGQGKRVYSAVKGNVTLTITDTSGKAGSIVAMGTGVTRGACIQLGNGGTLLLYNGKLDATAATCSEYGAGVSVGSGCTFRMYGGTIEGGNASSTAGGAGSVFVQGVFEMWDGVVKGGSAQNSGGNIYTRSGGVLRLYGGQVISGAAQAGGGNIFIAKDSKVLLLNGTITGGQAKNGGNIAIEQNGELTVSGGMIENGLASNTGGNIRIDGRFIMNGGTIKGGISQSKTSVSHNIYMAAAKENMSVNMTGGTVEGYFRALGAENLTLGGNAVIWNGAEDFDGFNLYIPSGKSFTLNTLQEKAKIGISGAGVITAQDASQSGYEGRIVSDYGEDVMLYSTNQLFIGRKTTAENCYCLKETVENDGHTCEDTYWSAWNSSTTLPTTTGNYYLTKPVTMEGLATIQADSTVILDLNGYTVTGKSGSSVYNANKAGVTLHITDSSKDGTGQMAATGSSSSSGRVLVFGNKEGIKVYLWAGTLIGATAKNNGGTLMQNGGELRMYERAAIQGGKADKRGDAVYVANGDFYLYGGTITGEVTLSDTNNVSLKAGKNAKISACAEGLGLTGGHEEKAVRTAPLLTLLDGTEALPEIHISENTDNTVVLALEEKQTTEIIKEEQRTRFTCAAGKQLLWGSYEEKGKVTVQSEGAHIHCACGGNVDAASACGTGHWPVVYQKLESTTKAHLGGNYYLAEDITIDKGLSTSTGSYSLNYGKTDLNLCLNGHTLTGNGTRRIFYTDGKVKLNVTGVCPESKKTAGTTDSKYGSLKTGMTSGKIQGSCLYTTEKGAVNLYQVYLDGSSYQYNDSKGGPTLYNNGTGQLKMYDCQISKHPDVGKDVEAYNGKKPWQGLVEAAGSGKEDPAAPNIAK